MNDEELKRVCDVYEQSIIEEDTGRYLMMMAKEIDRETRQKCASMSYDLANSIANLNGN